MGTKRIYIHSMHTLPLYTALWPSKLPATPRKNPRLLSTDECEYAHPYMQLLLESKRSLCRGYFHLFHSLAEAVGVKCLLHSSLRTRLTPGILINLIHICTPLYKSISGGTYYDTYYDTNLFRSEA